MTPQQFVDTWKKTSLSERSACHSHFLALCELLNQPKPVDADPEGAWYTFERGVNKSDGGHGWADVWKKGHFGWEYKKKRRDLKAAYDQLLMYREDLENPPLLVVCDMDRFEIHTNFRFIRLFGGLPRNRGGFSKAWLRCPMLAGRYVILLPCPCQEKRRQALLGSNLPRNILASVNPYAVRQSEIPPNSRMNRNTSRGHA